jgi:hypothetical protein
MFRRYRPLKWKSGFFSEVVLTARLLDCSGVGDDALPALSSLPSLLQKIPPEFALQR